MKTGHFYSLKIAKNDMLIEATGEESGNILAIKNYFKYKIYKINSGIIYTEVEMALPPTGSFTMTLSGPPIWNASFQGCLLPITDEIPKENLPLYMRYKIIFNRYHQCLKEM